MRCLWLCGIWTTIVFQALVPCKFQAKGQLRGHGFNRNIGTLLSSCGRLILWAGKPWWSCRIVLDYSWDTDEMVHLEVWWRGGWISAWVGLSLEMRVCVLGSVFCILSLLDSIMTQIPLKESPRFYSVLTWKVPSSSSKTDFFIL